MKKQKKPKPNKEKQSFKIGDEVFDTLHNQKGVIIAVHLPKDKDEKIVYTVKLENKETRNLNQEHLK